MEPISQNAELKIVTIDNENFIQITNSDLMKPFLMNIVSDSNHWMFVASNGGITLGRKNPEFSLLPYYTDDKLIELTETNGPKTIFQIHSHDNLVIWEPFNAKYTGKYKLQRSVYKNFQGNKIIFEEQNLDLQLIFRYQWNSSNSYGFVKKSELINLSELTYKVTILDGLQNILPYGIGSDLQKSVSNLGDAYKRSELIEESGLGIFSLSAMIVDKAEPSEALKANIAWSIGNFEKPSYLLSSSQLNNFRMGKSVETEVDKKGERGAYLVVSELFLPPNAKEKWKIVADVNLSLSNIIELSHAIVNDPELDNKIERDIEKGTHQLTNLVANADGLQMTADRYSDLRHYSNVLFNILRGGIFDDNYLIDSEDFITYLKNANTEVVAQNQLLLDGLTAKINRDQLLNIVKNTNDKNLIRLTTEYLPLKFSRRHGDPSRPWNYFNINMIDEVSGKKILDYEGNWRDLFQNWEPLAHSYPKYIDGMIFKFLNASTFDGYNPYRLSKNGFDWEVIEPDNPWSYIGYWGDHQVIYLLKFFEIAENYFPGLMVNYLHEDLFVYSSVPYIIKPFEKIIENPYDTIEFDHEWDKRVRDNRERKGADGALLYSGDNQIYRVNLLEKILAMVLAKFSNFIPEGGIWMNTQRPEWNDANNALVGNGISMVTLYYLRRFMNHLKILLENSSVERFKISNELNEFYHNVRNVMKVNYSLLDSTISDEDRRRFLNSIGKAASDYRTQIYKNGFWGKKSSISMAGVRDFVQICLDYIDHSIKANKRPDKLYHAYNIMTFSNEGVSISHLNEMLEGQVAVLSSGYLSCKESLDILNSLQNSFLYRKDQNSYILYPNKDLPGFLKKNTIPKALLMSSELLKSMSMQNDNALVEQDINGEYHFNGSFRNTKDLVKAIGNLPELYSEIAEKEKVKIIHIYEEVFHHKAFTGRSGTFFAYEGLGSIYWHMVSKLLLAAQEIYFKSLHEKDSSLSRKLQNHYFEIKDGLGMHKSPDLYGAFPTDPYSHTPMHKGAQQPGMTGQVKEDILVHLKEFGIHIHKGKINIVPNLLKSALFDNAQKTFEYFDLNGHLVSFNSEEKTIVFSYCQIPVQYKISDLTSIEIKFNDNSEFVTHDLFINDRISAEIFNRTNHVKLITISIPESYLTINEEINKN